MLTGLSCESLTVCKYINTRLTVRLVDILRAMSGRIATLIGAKFTSMDLYDCAECITLNNHQYDIIVGGETVWRCLLKYRIKKHSK